MFSAKTLKSKVEKAVKKLPWETNPDSIIELLKPAIAIKPVVVNENVASGQSKLGGLPHLPQSIQWPGRNGIPFAFAAQINLAEIGLNIQHPLPESGILYFFFSVNDDDYKNSLENAIHKVIYFSGDTSLLKPHDYPVNYNIAARFKECGLRFFEHYSLPAYQNYLVTEANLSNEDENLLWEAAETICGITGQTPDVGHQLLGNAAAVQGDVQYHWASQKGAANEKEHYNLQKEFVLLLQLDLTDAVTGFDKYGASGGIYFGLTANDLKNKQFDATVFVLQNS